MSKVTLEILSNHIYYYENLIDDPQKLVERINYTDKLSCNNELISAWQPWTSSNDDWVFGERKLIYPENYDGTYYEVQDIYNKIKDAIYSATKDYSAKSQNELSEELPRTISKYYTGSFMGPHTDEGPRAYISGVLYLNDDYEGGEISFPNQDVEIKPSAGSMIIFPSIEPYVHNPKIVTSGEKYMVPIFWFKD